MRNPRHQRYIEPAYRPSHGNEYCLRSHIRFALWRGVALLTRIFACGLLGVAVLLAGCTGKKSQAPPPVPVTVARVVVRPEPLSLSAVGTVEPVEAVLVKAQVGGVITEVNFSEGQDVREGQTLVQIDPRPFKAALEAATAQLAKDKFLAENAEIQAKRYQDLVKKDYVTQEQYDAIQTQAQALKSSVQADEASVEQARLNLGYASVSAPISGRTGSLLVKRGNVIKANDAAIVVINQMRPIRVSFAVPQGQLPLVQKYAALDKLDVRVRASSDGNRSEVKGRLVFLDNEVDPGTGTVTLKAEFSNEEGFLMPGQFVETELILVVEPDAITVPAAAIVTGQEGTFVFVIGPDKKAEKRSVKVNRMLDNTVVIDEGLKAGETVVTDGQLRLVPGAAVTIKSNLSK